MLYSLLSVATQINQLTNHANQEVFGTQATSRGHLYPHIGRLRQGEDSAQRPGHAVRNHIQQYHQ